MVQAENNLFSSLGKKLMKAGMKGLFDTWMMQESDQIQMAARAYGERLTSEQFLNIIREADPSLTSILTQIYQLYAVNCIERNLGWYLSNGIIPMELGSKVAEVSAELCRQLGPQALNICKAFGLTDEMISAPAALDWVKYNEYDNQGEVDPVML